MEYNDRVVTTKTVFARNCDVRKIDRRTAAGFLERNHIWGSASCRYCYGLFRRRITGQSEKASQPHGDVAPDREDGSLVAVACFSNARRWNKGGRIITSYEWVRYASDSDTRVVGGMGKLLNAFVEDRRPDDIMTYAISSAVPGRPLRDDGNIPDPGNVYRKLGFVEEGRKFFPSRTGGEGEYSESIKFRLRLK
ncbi:MAG: hypothetical protein ACI39U_00680 [Candidatus Cryptobacteroides sp.]